MGWSVGMLGKNWLFWQLQAAGAAQLSCQKAPLDDTLFQLH